MADDLDTAVGIEAVESREDLVMREAVLLFWFGARRRPRSDDGIVILRKRRRACVSNCNILMRRDAFRFTSVLLIGTESCT